jgi:hypothetical protein
VNDADGNSVSTNKTTFAVADAPLTDTTPTTTPSATEGNDTGSVVLMTFSDADPSARLADFSIGTIDWGTTAVSNTASHVELVSRTSTASNWEVIGNATYAEKGNYKVSITVNDADGNSVSTNKTTFAVADAALTDTTTARTIAAVAGTSIGSVVLATFTDADPAAPLADFSATVNWGGTVTGTPTSSVQLVSRTATLSTWQVVGSATYSAGGTYTAAVTVKEADGSTVSTSQTQFNVTAGGQQLLSSSIQHGATERSFIRYMDLSFKTTAGLSGFISGQGIRLTHYDVNGLHPTTVSLRGLMTVNGTHVTIDFGRNGIGGNPSTTAGDGTYRLAMDLAGNGTFGTVVQFFRLLGDVNGDGSVTGADVALFNADLRSGNLNGDVDGNGVLDTRDRLLIVSAMRHKIVAPH